MKFSLLSSALLVLFFIKNEAVVTTHIHHTLNHTGLVAGDAIRFPALLYMNRILQVRFFSDLRACGRTTGQCMPLVVRIYPRTEQLKVFRVGETSNTQDVEIASVMIPNLRMRRLQWIRIDVGIRNYTVKLSGKAIVTVNDTIGSLNIHTIRIHGAFLGSLKILRVEKSLSCGRRLGFANFRIANGAVAAPGEFPWQAALRLRERYFKILPFLHLCGVTLIDSCWVVTAAHCVELTYDYPRRFIIRVGDYFHREDSGHFPNIEDQQDFNIRRVIIHPNYSKHDDHKNDIALIQLRSKTSTCVRFSNFIQPACLPLPNMDFPPQTECTVTGWGALKTNAKSYDDYPTRLMKGVTRIHNHSQCQEHYGRNPRGEYEVGNTSICASNGIVDTCDGDSGGPLVCRRGLGWPFFLWGITSWGSECGAMDVPSVYTKVSVFVDWIHEKMSNNV